MGSFPDLNNNKNSSKHERVQQDFCGAALGGSACHCDDCLSSMEPFGIKCRYLLEANTQPSVCLAPSLPVSANAVFGRGF